MEELYFDDCTTPPADVVLRFFQVPLFSLLTLSLAYPLAALARPVASIGGGRAEMSI